MKTIIGTHSTGYTRSSALLLQQKSGYLARAHSYDLLCLDILMFTDCTKTLGDVLRLLMKTLRMRQNRCKRRKH